MHLFSKFILKCLKMCRLQRLLHRCAKNPDFPCVELSVFWRWVIHLWKRTAIVREITGFPILAFLAKFFVYLLPWPFVAIDNHPTCVRARAYVCVHCYIYKSTEPTEPTNKERKKRHIIYTNSVPTWENELLNKENYILYYIYYLLF